MNLSSELISQFVKATNDEPKTSSESTVYGTTVEYNGKMYVRIDGSDRLTPVETTTDMYEDERVAVTIKNHTATVTGNYSSPSARTDDVQEIGNKVTEFEIIVADKVSTKQLEAEIARIDTLVSDNVTIKEKLTATEAEIGKLVAQDVEINGKLTAAEADIDTIQADVIKVNAAFADYAKIADLEAVDAKIYNLEATYGEFVDLTTGRLEAAEAVIDTLDTTYATIESLQANYADIDFANITEAAVKKIFSDYGVIEEFVASDGTITKQLVAVEINGDLIKAGTIQVDRLIVKGDDGNYYAISSDFEALGVEPVEEDTIHGSILVAESVTAEKIRVDDLLAFKATIAGFNLKELEDGTTKAIYSGVKNSINNTTTGIYMDDQGQLYVGNASNYLKFFKDTDGSYKLDIAASTIKLGSGKTVEEAVDEAVEAADIQIGARNLIRNSETLIFEDYYFESSEASTLGIARLGYFTLGGEPSETETVEETGESEEAVETYGIAVASETTDTSSSSDYTPQGFVDGMILHDYHLVAMENAITKALKGVASARITTVSLPAASWSGSGTIYSQAVTMSEVTASSKIDLLPSPEQLNELLLDEISLIAANSDGSITVFALGAAPESDLELQAMITEVILPEVSS